MQTRAYYELQLRIKLYEIKSRIKWLFCEHSIVECGGSDWPTGSYIAYMCKKCRIQMRQHGKSLATWQSNYRNN